MVSQLFYLMKMNFKEGTEKLFRDSIYLCLLVLSDHLKLFCLVIMDLDITRDSINCAFLIHSHNMIK